jgi:hypothetical protein
MPVWNEIENGKASLKAPQIVPCSIIVSKIPRRPDEIIGFVALSGDAIR